MANTIELITEMEFFNNQNTFFNMEFNPILKEKLENNLDFILTRLNISIDLSGNEVTLKGIVNSFYEKTIIENIAMNTPGVAEVYNELVILN